MLNGSLLNLTQYKCCQVIFLYSFLYITNTKNQAYNYGFWYDYG